MGGRTTHRGDQMFKHGGEGGRQREGRGGRRNERQGRKVGWMCKEACACIRTYICNVCR